jgi:uncharacterized OsmC-like protein
MLNLKIYKMETIVKTVNGFSQDEIFATLETLKKDPKLADFKFRASNKWMNGGHNRSSIQGFYGGGQEDASRTKPFEFDNGEPPILLGNNEGANPVEYVLNALAGCMTTTLVLHAAAHGIQLDSVESTLEGDLDVQGFLGLDENVRNGYKEIRVKFKVEGDLSEEDKKKLYSFTQKSPVFDVITNKVPVKTELA